MTDSGQLPLGTVPMAVSVPSLAMLYADTVASFQFAT